MWITHQESPDFSRTLFVSSSLMKRRLFHVWSVLVLLNDCLAERCSNQVSGADQHRRLVPVRRENIGMEHNELDPGVQIRIGKQRNSVSGL
jgi:hypothetical protein